MCKIWTKNCQLFGENARKCQRAFRPMVNIFRMLTTLENLENLENSGNFLILENSGNFKFTQGIFVSVTVGIEFCA